MPPKYVKNRSKKAGTSKVAVQEEDSEDYSIGTLSMGGPSSSSKVDDSSTVALSVDERATVATEAGAGAAAVEDDDSWLTEALPGEEHNHRLMNEAMAKINVTTSTYAHKIHMNARDINISHLTVILKGQEMLVDAEVKLSYGCRYGLIGPNGCGKSILMTLLGRRMLPLPKKLGRVPPGI